MASNRKYAALPDLVCSWRIPKDKRALHVSGSGQTRSHSTGLCTRHLRDPRADRRQLNSPGTDPYSHLQRLAKLISYRALQCSRLRTTSPMRTKMWARVSHEVGYISIKREHGLCLLASMPKMSTSRTD